MVSPAQTIPVTGILVTVTLAQTILVTVTR